PECRQCMQWDAAKQDQDLLAFYKDLIALRHQYGALRTGRLTFLSAEEGSTQLAYSREDENDKIVILMNNSAQEDTLSVEVEESSWTDIRTGQAAAARQGKLEVKLPAYGCAMLKADK
ncbi:alpha-glucosidase C-terminal domain-containing protein, partial [Paenibacillus sp. AR247]|uniref:alpha-glucosidase C-terminal domain-containing protein n=1 Tax=Paenibacillus sp. AR247 TaxID=1631599 RepID=UPI0021588AF1